MTPGLNYRTTLAPLLGTLLAVFLYLWALLYSESQLAVGLLLVLAVAVMLSLRKWPWGQAVPQAAARAPGVLGLGCALGVTAIVAALHDTHYALLLLSTVLLFSVACLGLNIQFGYAGIVNFAGAAFFGIGSYTAGVLSQHTPTPHLLVLLAGGLASALLGSILILPVLRTRGHYAALVTIAFGILFRSFLEVNDTLGGSQGLKIPGLNLFGWKLNDPLEFGDTEISFYANYAILSLVLCLLAFAFVRRVERSWIGLSMDLIRTDEVAASVFGVSVARWKVVAFTFGNFLAGVAGAVYGMMTGYAAPNNFGFSDSLVLVSIVILGGIGNPWGVLPAATIVLILPEKFQFIQEYRMLLYAALVIAILVFRPAGLLPRTVRNYFPGSAR